MAYRFTETEKWKDSWFLDLSANAKLLFYFLCDNCDGAGFYERHDKTTVSKTGLSEESLDALYQEINKSIVIKEGVVWLLNYIRHQKNLPLNADNNAHKPIILKLYDMRLSFGEFYPQVLSLSVRSLRGLKGALEGLPSPIGKGNGKGKGKKPLSVSTHGSTWTPGIGGRR